MKTKDAKNSNVVKLMTRGVKLGVAAATAYYFFGPEGEKHREQTKSWAVKMKTDVIKKIKMTHDISEFAYHKIIDSVANKHAVGKQAEPKEIKVLAENLKKHWKKISNSVQVAKRDIVKVAISKTAKKATSKKEPKIK